MTNPNNSKKGTDLPNNIEKILDENDNILNSINKIKDTLPELLNYALSLEPKRAHWPNLSSFHDYDDGSGQNHLKASYSGHDGKIYAVIGDLDTGMIGGRSGMEEVSQKNFLKWVMELPERVIDVYKNLKSYIREKDSKPTEMHNEYCI